MTNLDQFPQNPLEIKKATGPLSIDNLSQTNDLATFKNWIDDYKEDILQKQTLQEVTDFLKVNPILKGKTADGANAFVFGGSVYVMTDSVDFEESLKTVQTHIDTANKEISESPVIKEAAEKAKDETKEVIDEAKDGEKNILLETMQKLADEQKKMKEQYEKFVANNVPADAKGDVEKMFSLGDQLEAATISNKALGAGAITAAAVEGLQEQNEYLRRQIDGYDKEGAAYKLEKFKPKNKKAEADLKKLMEMVGVSVVETQPKDSTTATASVEKELSQMTEAEKITKVKEIMGQLSGLQMTEQLDANGKRVYVMNMTAAQMDAITKVNAFGGPSFAYEQSGITQKNLTEIGHDRLIDKIQKAQERGNYKKENKLLEKMHKNLEKQIQIQRDNQAYSQSIAEMRNEGSYRNSVTRGSLDLAKGNAYAGKTVDVIPYAPLFTNICQNINTVVDRGHVTMDVVGLGTVICQCPERYNVAYNQAASGVANLYGVNQDAVDVACGGPSKPGLFGTVTGLFEDGLSHTNMTKEQAHKNATLLTGISAIAVGYGLYNYIFKGGENKDGKGWFKRLATVIGVGVGTNILSQAGTGMGLVDNLAKIKEVGIGKRWDTVTSGVDKNSAEYKGGEVEMFRSCFYNVPYSVVACGCEKGADGYPKVKNLQEMITKLYELEATTTDPDRKAQIAGQIAFLKDLDKDVSKKDILNAAFVSMGMKYEEIANPANATKTANEKIDATAKEKGDEAKKEAAEKAKKDKEAKEKKDKERTVDTSDPNVKLDAKGNPITAATSAEKIDVTKTDPNAKLDKALHGVDLTLAQELQEARRKLMDGKAIEAHYKLVNGTLNVESYQMYTPIQYKDGKWFIGGYSDRRDAVSNFSQGFDSADQAVWVANLTNRLIALETGRHEITTDEDKDTKPFNVQTTAGGGDLEINSGSWYKPDTEAVDGGWFAKSSTLKEFGGESFQNNIGAYARYLNGLTNKNNGKSIWSTEAKIAGVGDITKWFNQVNPMPARKESDKVKNGGSETGTTTLETKKVGPTAPTPEKAPEKANNIDITNEAIAKKALELKNKFGGKDGGSKENPNDQYVMSDDFFKAWATAYIAYGIGNGPETFTFNYVDSTGKKKAILYKRQPGAKAPLRESEVEGKR